MIQSCDGSGLSLEEAIGFFRAFARSCGLIFPANDFNGDLLANAAIFGQVDLAHAPASQQVQQMIVTQMQPFQWHVHHLSTQKITSYPYAGWQHPRHQLFSSPEAEPTQTPYSKRLALIPCLYWFSRLFLT